MCPISPALKRRLEQLPIEDKSGAYPGADADIHHLVNAATRPKRASARPAALFRLMSRTSMPSARSTKSATPMLFQPGHQPG